MAVCTFFGHRDCIGLSKQKLEEAIENLILNHGVDLFYVGNEGQFDALVHWVLFAMKKKYPHICYAVVLAYPPKNIPGEDYSDTMLPEGIETVHPRYAITWRNRWMLQRADYVITYVNHPWGGAAERLYSVLCHRAQAQRGCTDSGHSGGLRAGRIHS